MLDSMMQKDLHHSKPPSIAQTKQEMSAKCWFELSGDHCIFSWKNQTILADSLAAFLFFGSWKCRSDFRLRRFTLRRQMFLFLSTESICRKWCLTQETFLSAASWLYTRCCLLLFLEPMCLESHRLKILSRGAHCQGSNFNLVLETSDTSFCCLSNLSTAF